MRTPKFITVREALAWAKKELGDAATPALDAQILLMHATRKSREDLLINPDARLTSASWKKFAGLIAKRKKNIPVAYLIGGREFYGIWFKVTKNTLIPRPATEAIVTKTIELAETSSSKQIIEIGTGSGAIAVTLAKQLPKIKIVATDISAPALAVARSNAKIHKVAARIKFVKANLLGKIPPAGLIVANLPYLPKSLKVAQDIRHEPRLALFDGSRDGLGLYKKLFGQIDNATVVIELGAKQYLPMKSWLTKELKAKVQPIYDLDKTVCGLTAVILRARPE